MYKRGRVSRFNTEVRNLVLLLNSEREQERNAAIAALQKRSRTAQLRIPHDVTFKIAEVIEADTQPLRAAGLQYEKGHPELVRIRKQIEEQLRVAFILRNRREPNAEEKTELHTRAHPHYEKDLEEVNRITRPAEPSSSAHTATTPGIEDTDDGEYAPSWAR